MGFIIECSRGAVISRAGAEIEVNVGQIKQLVGQTEKLASPSPKGADEQWKAVFAAQTPYGLLSWDVLFSHGDADPSLDDIELANAPEGVEVVSQPDFAFTEV